ncbi:hypothetical protein NHX12_018961 [Muraenolepis orangiensis]|uniref:Uncharacterized protein n=1 Tax=Muraenolepis orangiensis TaxID=630683 RepID=A0A9Q0IWT5_9TELE|nr:hypothetical protein NHX12_018961 [Muraenolepis orangiensis]
MAPSGMTHKRQAGESSRFHPPPPQLFSSLLGTGQASGGLVPQEQTPVETKGTFERPSRLTVHGSLKSIINTWRLCSALSLYIRDARDQAIAVTYRDMYITECTAILDLNLLP